MRPRRRATQSTEKFPPPHVCPPPGKQDRAPPTSALIVVETGLATATRVADVRNGSLAGMATPISYADCHVWSEFLKLIRKLNPLSVNVGSTRPDIPLMVRTMRRLPNPYVSGATTAGPPRSCQVNVTTSPSHSVVTLIVPLDTDSAPYFTAFVTISCITNAMFRALSARNSIVGPEYRIRSTP